MAITLTNSQVAANYFSTWGFTATAGRVLIAAAASREWNVTWTPSGWTVLAKRNLNTPGEMNAFLFAKVAAGGETAFGGGPPSAGASLINVAEWTGLSLTGFFDGGPGHATSGIPVGASVSPTAGAECLVCAMLSTNGANQTPLSGWSGIGGSNPPPGESDWPRGQLVYKIVPSPSGSYQPSAAANYGVDWASATAILYSGVTASLARSQSLMVG